MNYDDTLRAQWVVDSESGVQYLIDLETGKVLGMKDEKGRFQNV
jgi:hypothetical protein